MENKIAKTERSIKLLEEHLTNRTCPKSLRYTAKPNITPDETFEKELKDIKLDAEQSLVGGSPIGLAGCGIWLFFAVIFGI